MTLIENAARVILEDHRRAVKDVTDLSRLMSILTSGDNMPPKIPSQVAILNSIGHNLDIQGSAEQASSLYQRLLKTYSDRPKVIRFDIPAQKTRRDQIMNRNIQGVFADFKE